MWWPRVSLTFLKPSRSKLTMALARTSESGLVKMPSRHSMIWLRFGSSVSESKRARRAIWLSAARC